MKLMLLYRHRWLLIYLPILLALAGVLASVHTLLLADHWWVLIAAWALVGVALQQLLVFYPERPFALLAAHKKRLADRLADILLLAAAALAWSAVGSGHLPDLWAHLAQHGAGPALQASAVCLALAVVLRTALLPVHGWLIQVMEAPTPVSALLHAGVVNLGGFVLLLRNAVVRRVVAVHILVQPLKHITDAINVGHLGLLLQPLAKGFNCSNKFRLVHAAALAAMQYKVH
mgnify:CR=1 FL=1